MMWKIFLLLAVSICLYGNNQTAYVTQPLSEETLPFRLSIAQANFSLPAGLHSFVFAQYKGEWLLLAGRTYGLHGFAGDSFPVAGQNTVVYVVNPKTGQTFSRSLYDAASGLSQEQIDQLSVTNALFYQEDGGDTLYIVGGYGINTSTSLMETKPLLSAIDVPLLIKWVKHSPKCKSAAKSLRQVSHPLLQVTGGVLRKAHTHEPFLIGMGQTFMGNYTLGSSGVYTHQIRPFQVIDTGKELFIHPHSQPRPNPFYRRRDLNIVPIIKKMSKSYKEAFVALAGVFTPGPEFGGWTIPIEINTDGSSSMIDPDTHPGTFAQGMNVYSCAHAGLYSKKTDDMFILLFGGISFLCASHGGCYHPGGSFKPHSNLPFTNDVTTIRIDSSGTYRQYFMKATFPKIPPFDIPAPSVANPTLLFGASSSFIPSENLPHFQNGVISLDKLGSSPLLLGYIVGGIQSAQKETDSEITNVDTRASSYIFTVTLEPN